MSDDEKEESVNEYVDIGINITSDLFGMQKKKKKDHWEDVLDRAVRAGVTYVFFFPSKRNDKITDRNNAVVSY
mgnify:CR=1 FL=1